MKNWTMTSLWTLLEPEERSTRFYRNGRNSWPIDSVRLRLKCDGTRAEIRFRLSAKRTNPFKSAGASVQSITGSRAVRIGVSTAGYTMFRGNVRVLATHSICQFPLLFPSRASPCAIRFQMHSTSQAFKRYFSLMIDSVLNYQLLSLQFICRQSVLFSHMCLDLAV
jgi:hypothetical protein